MTIAGGVNLILSPDFCIGSTKMRVLAADGRCKTFDSRADGTVFGEGCGVVILKRLSDALAAGDHIHALIRGSAVNHDGRTNGLTAPSMLSQEELVRRALRSGGVDASQVGFVEAHGTGTALGDPIEVEALSRVFVKGGGREGQCLLGAVKSNIGHLGAAAGIAGLIKVVLSLQQREVPPNLHFRQLNPHISLEETPFVISTRLQPRQTLRGRQLLRLRRHQRPRRP
jgi:acyl transferase domain-containing protein